MPSGTCTAPPRRRSGRACSGWSRATGRLPSGPPWRTRRPTCWTGSSIPCREPSPATCTSRATGWRAATGLRKFNQRLDLVRLQETAEALVRDELPSDLNAAQVQDLLLLGTSMGGARPKAVIQDHGELWIAKFARPDDRWNFERVEHAMLQLARRCGITTAESLIETVAGKDILLVKRFDRQGAADGYTRARMISGLTVLRTDDAVSNRDRWSYIQLAEEIRRVVHEPKRDTRELFRRIVFNALISNIDDHPRNHALIAPARQWSLSPAYDLTPSPQIGQDHRELAMVCGDEGRFANAANILSQHARLLQIGR